MPNRKRKAPDISSAKKPRRKLRISKIFPLLLFGLFALFILKEQVPALNDKYLALVKPNEFHAIEVCREAALAKSSNRKFARLINYGEANRTQQGFFIDHILVGELVPDSGESRFTVNCHIDQSGTLANVHAQAYLPQPISSIPPVISDFDSD